MKKRNLVISVILILLAIIFTILVKNVDVNTLGANGSNIGFSTLNRSVFDNIGVNMTWYNITNCLGIISIIIALAYVLIGLIQLVKRKNVFKVDKEIIALGIFYVILAAIYIAFEIFIVNYRPILMDGELEASYPSSHTMLTIFICGSAILINSKLFNDNKIAKITNVVALILMIVTVIGRLLSGVHWFTDILGGIIIASALLMSYYTVLDYLATNKTNITENE